MHDTRDIWRTMFFPSTMNDFLSLSLLLNTFFPFTFLFLCCVRVVRLDALTIFLLSDLSASFATGLFERGMAFFHFKKGI